MAHDSHQVSYKASSTVSLVTFAEPERLLGFQVSVKHLGKTSDGSQFLFFAKVLRLKKWAGL